MRSVRSSKGLTNCDPNTSMRLRPLSFIFLYSKCTVQRNNKRLRLAFSRNRFEIYLFIFLAALLPTWEPKAGYNCSKHNLNHTLKQAGPF